MFKNIHDFSDDLVEDIVLNYQYAMPIEKIMSMNKLSRNEVLSILSSNNIQVDESDLSSFTIGTDEFVVISDTHIGSRYENLKYIKNVYNFALENGVKEIIHTGDLLHSTLKGVHPDFNNLDKQLKHFQKHYPTEINTHILLGNHDYHVIHHNEDYIKEIKFSKKIDIVGYKRAYFTFAKKLLSLSHGINKHHLPLPNANTTINFYGHRHECRVVDDIKVFVPTLSNDIKMYEEENYPGFLLVTSNNNTINVEHYRIDDEKITHQSKILSKKI